MSEKAAEEFEKAQVQAMMRSQPDLDLRALIKWGCECGITSENSWRHAMEVAELDRRITANKWLDADYQWRNGPSPITEVDIDTRITEMKIKYAKK